MQIVIDLYDLSKFSGKTVGVYNYSKFVTKAIVDSAAETDKIVLICSEENALDLVPQDFRGELMIAGKGCISKLDKIYWDTLGAKRYFARQKIQFDVYYNPRGFIPIGLASLFRCVYTTIHDLIPFIYSDLVSGAKKIENRYICNRLKYSAKASTTLFTSSNASANDIAERKWNRKILPVYIGIDHMQQSIGITEPRTMLFAVASALHHKNASKIISSYSEYVQKNGSKALPLTICGLGSLSEIGIILPEPVARMITLCKGISDADLQALYGKARLFIFLSLAEGFGLPPFEALFHGTPILISDIPVFREVFGGYADFVNPLSEVEISDAITKIIQSNVSADYGKVADELRRKYSWNNHAKIMLNTFRNDLDSIRRN